MQRYRTKEHDVLDAIVVKAYGDCNDDMLNIIYEANPGLADYDPLLPSGVVIMLPDTIQPTPAADQQGVSLWD